MYTELSKGTIKQTETMACSDSTGNTLELCKQDNARGKTLCKTLAILHLKTLTPYIKYFTKCIL